MNVSLRPSTLSGMEGESSNSNGHSIVPALTLCVLSRFPSFCSCVQNVLLSETSPAEIPPMYHQLILRLPSNRTFGFSMLMGSDVVRRTTPSNLTVCASCSLPLKTMKRDVGIISSVALDLVLLLVYERGVGTMAGIWRPGAGPGHWMRVFVVTIASLIAGRKFKKSLRVGVYASKEGKVGPARTKRTSAIGVDRDLVAGWDENSICR